MKTLIAFLVICLLGYILYRSISGKEDDASKVKTVYFYPKKNVYYQVGTGKYIFYDTVEKAWNLTKNFSEEQKLSLGEKAVIENPPAPVWKNNAEDRLIYSANLYSSPSDIKEKFQSDSINSLPPKPVIRHDTAIAKVPVEDEKPKSGLRKFFDKLFGGKDKAADSKN
ncbi:MAG TPA: hypothetical protein VJ499_07015 [Flavisolibacter sp.]|nr:hypothetical protein [Flavisolibacter sp.]